MLDAMDAEIVNRIVEMDKGVDENGGGGIEKQECSVCFDNILPGVIPSGCGHAICRECAENIIRHASASSPECPQCRGDMDEDTLIPIPAFLKKYNRDAYDALQEAGLDAITMEASPESSIPVDPKILAIDPTWVSSTKVKVLFENIIEIQKEAPSDKIIVFSQFTKFLELLETPLQACKIGYAIYNGKMALAQRVQAITKFKTDSKCNVMLISLKCGSLGLNLVCANRVFLLDLWWNPAVESQAIDRAHRIGQKSEVTVYRIVIKDSVEDRILQMQEKKKAIIDGAFGVGGSGGNAKLNEQDLMTLFGY